MPRPDGSSITATLVVVALGLGSGCGESSTDGGASAGMGGSGGAAGAAGGSGGAAGASGAGGSTSGTGGESAGGTAGAATGGTGGTSCIPNDNECGPDDCGGSHPACATGTCRDGACRGGIDDFEMIFSQNFEDSPAGNYLRTVWSDDWGLSVSAWSDPCRDACADESNWAEALLTIEEEGGNHFLRHALNAKGLSDGASGTAWWKGLGDHEELYLSYRIRFSGGDWAGTDYHGKLPGFCGSAGCPGGGKPPTHEDGFSTRYMFHGTEDLFFYLYYAGMDTSDGLWGDSLYFEPYGNVPEQWRTLTQRVVLNTPGTANGILEGFLDGLLVAQKTDMDYRNASDQTISTLVFANFLGGSGEEPADQGDLPTIDFDDVAIFRYQQGVPGVVRGLQAHSSGAVIDTPAL